ncbi:nucleotidyltransferase-like protein [Cohnella pontilimi]|uniref:nucleotidyltransferase-like protein n=1 Tax=Cohnella pontilimi TaxID=2564100 RepID=UPI001FED0D94|nr:nucleotidyltransferase-like protein [Cohnella pontilimi]
MNGLDSKKWYYRDWFAGEEGLVGLLLVSDPYAYQPQIHGMDRLIVVVREQVNPEEQTEHWLRDDVRIQVRRIEPAALERWVASGDRKGVQWLVQGDVLSDPTGYLERLRRRLEEWPQLLREQKLLCEFSGFIGSYLSAKQDLKNGQVLDSYSQVLASLHYWARIVLVEEGMHPELTVWEQVHRVNPGIYKLYEELTVSQETLEKRVQLVILACEFAVMTKMRASCALLIRLLGSRHEPWTVAQLQQDPHLLGLPLDMSLLLRKLAKRGCIRELAKPVRGHGAAKLELRYTASQERA